MVTTDRGSEFIAEDFKTLLEKEYGITPKTITTRNPQDNAVLERIHQEIVNIV